MKSTIAFYEKHECAILSSYWSVRSHGRSISQLWTKPNAKAANKQVGQYLSSCADSQCPGNKCFIPLSLNCGIKILSLCCTELVRSITKLGLKQCVGKCTRYKFYTRSGHVLKNCRNALDKLIPAKANCPTRSVSKIIFEHRMTNLYTKNKSTVKSK